MNGLFQRFRRSAEAWPKRPAVAIGGVTWTYEQLSAWTSGVSELLGTDTGSSQPELTAVLGSQSFDAYVGVLAALHSGHGFVPLNPLFPAATHVEMLEITGTGRLIVAPEALSVADAVLGEIARPLLVVLPTGSDATAWQRRHPQHRITESRQQTTHSQHVAAEPESTAYVMFTSGSTGRPKGVMVPHRAIEHFLAYMLARYAPNEHDRFSQTFPLNFDLSVFDLFMAWSVGACVCAPTREQGLTLGHYIQEQSLTVWFSTPSAASLIRKIETLPPGSLPGLRLALFCGEALPLDITAEFAAAAANATVENLYGPTELTLCCTLYRYDERTRVDAENGIVPIGDAYPGMIARIVDDALQPVPVGSVGELLMTGPQLATGYLNDPERTRQAFIVPPGEDRIYYRTGDRVRSPAVGEPIKYLGRADGQVKLHGVRIELAEIEAAVRSVTTADIVAVAWPRTASGAEGIVVFVCGAAPASRALRSQLAGRLPPYALPRRFVPVDAFPLTPNGKVDRQALCAQLDAEMATLRSGSRNT